MADSGDTVKIITKKGREEEGILVPSHDEAVLLLKLPNGYNLGLKKKEIKTITVVGKGKPKKVSTAASPSVKGKRPTIAILHTGGTIASKVDYNTGGVYAGFTATDFLELFPEMKFIAQIRSRHVSTMMSEDMRFSHQQAIAKVIKEEIAAGVDGIIIGHGTDTLGVTSAALSFMFENVAVPILLVGAQRSSDRGSSDAGMNLLCAAEFIVRTDFAGIALCMHESSSDDACVILPPTKTRKLHTSRRDAFKVVNDTPLARIEYATKKVTFLKPYTHRQDVKKPLVLREALEEKVAIIKTYVNMNPVLINALTAQKYKGLVLEATGIGQAPTNIPENLPNYAALQRFIKQGGVVVLTSQCIFGRVHADIYTNCRRLKEIGIVFGADMLTETAHVKLAWLLAHFPHEKVMELLAQNLRGEINPQLGYDAEFIAPH